MSRRRVNITLDKTLLRKAKEEGINISRITERAIRNELEADKRKYFIVNTNKKHLPRGNDGTGIYERGVTATFGPREYGEKLETPQVGDFIISYVNGIGVRALGIVTGRWDGRAVSNNEVKISPDRDEYHLPTRWLVILPESRAVSPTTVRKIVGYPPYGSTRKEISRDNDVELLVDIIKGRAYGAGSS